MDDVMKAKTDEEKLRKLLRKLRKRNRELLRMGKVKRTGSTRKIDGKFRT